MYILLQLENVCERLIEAVADAAAFLRFAQKRRFSVDLELLTEGEAAEVLRLSPATLATWRSRGGGPAFVGLGGRVVYERAALVEFVQRNRRAMTKGAAMREFEAITGR